MTVNEVVRQVHVEMMSELRFSVLGPVRLRRDGRHVAAGSPQQQAVLAALVLHEGQAAPGAELIRAVWGENPPPGALGTARSYISRLRRLLDGTRARIVTVGGDAYALTRDGVSADVWDLREALTRAPVLIRQNAAPEAAALLRRVLSGWSGDSLDGIRGSWAEGQRARLGEMRIAALTLLLRIDRHSPQELAALTALVDAHPLNEGLRALLVLALHRDGRRAEALETFRHAQVLLREELGLEPGAALREAQLRVLRDEPGATGPPVVAASRPVSHLPALLTDFTGRAGETAALEAALHGPGTVAGLIGMGGSGRTVTAVRVAHRLTKRFPDGQVYADLAEAGDPLLHLLSLLVPGVEPPAGPAARAAVLSSHLAGRRLLLVVDNVTDPQLIQLLRRAAPEAALLFTSYRRFHGMADATWVRLRELPHVDALALFTAVAGDGRAAAEPAAVDALVGLSGGCPLAVRVFAQRVHGLRQWSVAAIADNLRAEMANPVPSGHDDCVLLGEPVERTYATLPPAAARALRLLGVLPDEPVPAARVAAVLGLPVHQAFLALTACIDACLLDEAGSPHHYRLADPVVRTVMMRLAYAIDGAAEVARVRAASAAPSREPLGADR